MIDSTISVQRWSWTESPFHWYHFSTVCTIMEIGDVSKGESRLHHAEDSVMANKRRVTEDHVTARGLCPSFAIPRPHGLELLLLN